MGFGSVGGDLSVTESCAAGSGTPAVVCVGAGWLGGGVGARASWVGGGAVTSAGGGNTGASPDGPVMVTSRAALHKGDKMPIRKMRQGKYGKRFEQKRKEN